MPPKFVGARSVDLPPFKERVIALRLIPRFLGMVWRAQPVYGAAIVSFRVLLAFSPVVQLWIGKLIIDGILANIGVATPDSFARPALLHRSWVQHDEPLPGWLEHTIPLLCQVTP